MKRLFLIVVGFTNVRFSIVCIDASLHVCNKDNKIPGCS